MKHAGPAALDALDALLHELRALPGLKEKSRGVFYRKGQSFLHFHEDPSGLYADLRSGTGFVRFALHTDGERAALLEQAAAALRTA